MTPLWIPFVTVPLLCSMHRPRARPEVFAKNPSLLEPEDSGKNLSLLDRTSTPVAPMTNPESTHQESPGSESTLHQRVAMISNGTYEVVATDVDGESPEEVEAVEKKMKDVNIQIGDLIDRIQSVSNELSFRETDHNMNQEAHDRSIDRSERVKEMLWILYATWDATGDYSISQKFLDFVADKKKKFYPNVPERGPQYELFKLNATVQFCVIELEWLTNSMRQEDFDLQEAIRLTQRAVNLASMQSDEYRNLKERGGNVDF